MSRAKRQSKILEIINNSSIETQDDLVRELSNNGFKVTQATISRDIKDLGLIKAATEGGVSRYVTVKSVDYIIDLGPEGGDKGGEIVAQGTPESVAQVDGSYTGKYLKKMLKN